MVLYHWRIKLKIPTPVRKTASLRSAQSLPELVEVRPTLTRNLDTAPYEIVNGPWRIRFSGNFDDQSLQRILRLLP